MKLERVTTGGTSYATRPGIRYAVGDIEGNASSRPIEMGVGPFPSTVGVMAGI